MKKETKKEATVFFPSSWTYAMAYWWLIEFGADMRGDMWEYDARWVYRIKL